MRSQKRHALIGFSFIEDEQPYNHGLLHGIFVDLLAPFLQSFDRSELIYLRLISSWGYHLITRTFWNWFQLISVKVHHSQVTLWAGRGHYWPPSCSMFWFLALFFSYRSPPLSFVKDEKIMERNHGKEVKYMPVERVHVDFVLCDLLNLRRKERGRSSVWISYCFCCDSPIPLPRIHLPIFWLCVSIYDPRW